MTWPRMRTSRTFRCFLAGFVMLSCLPCSVLAQSVSATPEATQANVRTYDDDEARTAFREGTEAAETERWADSERAFRRAYALSHAPSALFNRAVALRALGRHVEARDAFDELLAETDAPLESDLRESARTLRAESASRVASLTLTGLTLSPHRIRLDGRSVNDSMSRPLVFELDEGLHTVEVTREGHTSAVLSEELLPGEKRELRITLSPLPSSVAPAEKTRKHVWWWVGGAAAVVASGLTATTIVLLRRDDDEPLSPRASTVYEVP